MVAHNNVLPNAHFRKHWDERVKTWFDQPGKKKSRRIARQKKAALIAPRPVDGPLRPAVRCPTLKYNMKVRLGRGFSLDELKEAGISRKQARTIGIAVDFRRKNRSVESLQLNVQRLQAYKAKLIVFPRKASKPKKTDSDAALLKEASQLQGKLMPLSKPSAFTEAPRAITAEEKNASAYATLRNAQSVAKYVGIRAKRLKEKQAAEEQKAKA